MQMRLMHIIIDSPGTSLRIQDGVLSIKQQEQIKRFPLGKVQNLYLAPGIHLTSDVLYRCLEFGVEVLVQDRDGSPLGRLWNNRFGSISTIRRLQLEFSAMDKATDWVIDVLIQKIRNQNGVLDSLYSLPDPQPRIIHDVQQRLKNIIEDISCLRGNNLQEQSSTLRSLEAQATKRYFYCINEHLPFSFRFKRRSQHPALDKTNALLNYSYGMLYGWMESALIKAGLDPYIGIFHQDAHNRPVLTYDCIEPFRPWADWVVWHLCYNEVMDDTFFQVEKDSFWLDKSGKRILIQQITDAFEEIITYQEKRFSRMNHMQQFAYDLARNIQS